MSSCHNTPPVKYSHVYWREVLWRDPHLPWKDSQKTRHLLHSAESSHCPPQRGRTAVTVHLCRGSFTGTVRAIEIAHTFAQRKRRMDFLFSLRKLFTLIHLIPRLICHWSLKQSIFYGDFSYLWTKFKLANEPFLLSLLKLREGETVWGYAVEEGEVVGGADGPFQQAPHYLTAEEKDMFQRTKKNTKLGLFSSN